MGALPDYDNRPGEPEAEQRTPLPFARCLLPSGDEVNLSNARPLWRGRQERTSNGTA